jgi:hypothetical protein
LSGFGGETGDGSGASLSPFSSVLFPLALSRAGLTVLVYREIAQLYAKLAARLFAGETLSAEDLIDLYTLKENTRENVGDFATALEVLVRAKVGFPRFSIPFIPPFFARRC